MSAIKNYFKKTKWYDYLIVAVLDAIIISVGVVFKSSFLTIFNSFVGITGGYFVAKGRVTGQVFCAIQSVTYSVLCFYNKYFGEIIISLCVALPIYLFAIVNWCLNKDKETKAIKINKGLSWKEWVCLIVCLGLFAIAIYFLLKGFNTANLVLSTLSAIVATLAQYLSSRRFWATFLFSFFKNSVRLILWLNIAFVVGDFAYLITAMNYMIYLCQNVFGLINWLRLLKKQNYDVCDRIIGILKTKLD